MAMSERDYSVGFGATVSSAGVWSPGRLWSLWDMLELYGHHCAIAVRSCMEVERDLAAVLSADPKSAVNIETETLSRNPAFFIPLQVRLVKEVAESMQLHSTLTRCNRLLLVIEVEPSLAKVAQQLEEIRRQFEDDLRRRHFLSVSEEDLKFWDKDHLFGETVSRKFTRASWDIKNAGNCLALGQGTACVFHLMRAMEVAVRKLAKKMNVTITPQSTWRKMTGLMDDKIKKMPDTTDRLKRKKNDWEGARANLHHVGSVWRNNTMHPATSYTPSQAQDVFNAVRVFMVDICKL
jgi:hypothetical protein